jgi:uncharacterized lipoprotein YmbA
MTRSGIAGAAVALLIWGCASSPPLRYYVLSETPPAGSATSSPSSNADSVQVTKVALPRELDRNELVQRIDTTRVHIAEDDRWAAPLDDLIRRALAADLRAHAQTRRAGQVSVQIESFSADMACGVELRASWEWREPGSNTPPERQRADIQIASAGHTCPISEVPVRMSEALAQLADRMMQ